jgi:hypothetical protein
MEQMASLTSLTMPEDVLSHELGMNRQDVRAQRGERGVDWELIGNRIYWSEKAAACLVARLSPRQGVETPPPSKNTQMCPVAQPPAQILSGVEVLRVTQWRFPNRHVIHALPVNGNNGHSNGPITVRVKDSHLFRPGMQILARPQAGSAWNFEGNPEKPGAGIRYPRRPGVW